MFDFTQVPLGQLELESLKQLPHSRVERAINHAHWLEVEYDWETLLLYQHTLEDLDYYGVSAVIKSYRYMLLDELDETSPETLEVFKSDFYLFIANLP